VLFQGTIIDQNVVYVDDHKVIKPFLKNVIHESAKCSGCIGEPKGHHQELLSHTLCSKRFFLCPLPQFEFGNTSNVDQSF
jgi:hypothetical protein